MRLVIEKNYDGMSRWAAAYIAEMINMFTPTAEKPWFVLGLPTGSTPLGTYRELIALHREGRLSFANVVTFNMDEYVGLEASHPQSYRFFMMENLFNHIDIDKKNVHILDGMAKDPAAECAAYEKAIAEAGGVDLFMGGMGVDGHIAFNEPGSSFGSRTRIMTLTPSTRIANARFFGGNTEQVPDTAMTVGIATVTDAREVLILASGYAKARALRHSVEEGVNHMWPLSCLQNHQKTIIVCDEEATDELRVGTVRYFKKTL